MTTNKYQGTCTECGGTVPAGEGTLAKGATGWDVTHTTCPQLAPEAVAQPADTATRFTPTAEQIQCVKYFATGEHLVIQAGAGAGKTSTLLLLAQHALANGRTGQYCAYNSAIVKDVARKLPGNVNASTMHSLAYQAVGYRYKHRLNSGRQRADEQARILGLGGYSVPFGGSTKLLAGGFLAGLVMGAVRRFCTSAATEITASHFERVEGIDLPDDNGNKTYRHNDDLRAHLLPYAQRAWADLVDVDGKLRFSHDVYLKIWSMSDPRIAADFVMLDEAQDADPVQIAIVENQRKFGTQVVVVGDEMQVLYEWRGAIDGLARFEAMGARVAFLTQSFRFGNDIATVANGLLGRLDARLRVRGYGPQASTVGPDATPDCVLTRSNAGAVRRVFTEIENGRKPHLVGGGADVVAFCKGALALQDGRPTQHPELACFATWGEVQDYVDTDSQGEELRLMVRLVDQFGAEEIIAALSGQAQERYADLVISTAHKAKGREWDRVQIASDFKPPLEGGDLSPAELRLAYVACTRAKRNLDISAVEHFAPGWKPSLPVPDPTNPATY